MGHLLAVEGDGDVRLRLLLAVGEAYESAMVRTQRGVLSGAGLGVDRDLILQRPDAVAFAVEILGAAEVTYLRLEDVNGGILYEISSSEPVGFLSNDENGFLTFTGNPPVADEPMALAEETTVETTVETLAPVETEATAAAEETAAPETAAEAATEETAASSASAIPEEIGETVWEETQAPTTEATVPPTTEATVPPTTVPVETVPDIEVTEPVMIHDKPLSSYQVNRMEYYDSTLGETVTAKYVYVPMPELTVTLYVDTTEVGYPGVWDLVRIVQHLRQYLLPMAALCLLGFAVRAVYLCSAAGCKPGIPEIRAGGLNRIPLDLYLVGGGCLVAGFVAGGVALTGYLAQSDLFTACCAGLLLVYLGCLVFVGFCYAVAAQLKTPGGFWWRNTLCGWSCGCVPGLPSGWRAASASGCSPGWDVSGRSCGSSSAIVPAGWRNG